MPNIDQINISGELTGEDRFLIYDSETGSARTVTASVAKSFFNGKDVSDLSYSSGTLSIQFSGGSKIDVTGFPVKSLDLSDMPSALEAGKMIRVNQLGSAYVLDLIPTFSGDSARTSYLTTTSSPIKQIITANDTPQTISFTSVDVPSDSISVNTSLGEFTFLVGINAVFTVSAQVIREIGAAGIANWVMFADISTDNGLTWAPLSGSARRVSFASQSANEYRSVDFTASAAIAAGTKLRFRHATNDASKQIGIISAPAIGGTPSSAGFMASFFSVKRG